MRAQPGVRSFAAVAAFAAVVLVVAGSALAAARVTLPTISTFKPTSVKPASKVTISGKNLKGATAVTVAGMKMKFKVSSATKIVVTLSASAKTGEIKVTTPHGTAVSTQELDVT